MAKKHKSDALAAIHESMGDLNKIGLIDEKTMKYFDISCLTPVEELSPEEIAKIRNKVGVSQAVFAAYLNVTTGLVSQWERGIRHPRGASLKLLTLVKQKGLSAVA